MIALGDKLDGKYVVVRRLGSGGFGEVFLAVDSAVHERLVAIKVLSRGTDGDHSNLVWEMQALAKFNHPHVVSFYHWFEDAGQRSLVMEYCRPGSLRDRLRTSAGRPPNEVFAWGLDLCETLAFVHSKGIVHHDIKPENILFADDGTIKLGDFGVANRHAGTLLYLSPEMREGDVRSPLDPRVDVYALGLTMFEALAGYHPFDGLTSDGHDRAQYTQDFFPADMTHWVQEILLRATHPTPELRFQTASDFAEAIRARHVPHVFDASLIKAHAWAEKAEAAMARRKWKRAETLTIHALEKRPDCVAALLAAGRCQLLLRRMDRAKEYFSRAQAISPRTPVHKDLGWIALEEGRLPAAISLLSDHLQRHASDYEAYNLLMKAYFASDRYDAAASLAATLLKEKVPSDCFWNNLMLCHFLVDEMTAGDPRSADWRGHVSPFMTYNRAIAREDSLSWSSKGRPTLKSKLLFQEYRFGSTMRQSVRNVVAVHGEGGHRRDFSSPIVTIGSLPTNDIVIKDQNVSRRHCLIVNLADDVWLYDLESTAGTSFEGQRMAGRVFLEGVHEVTVGRVGLRIAARSDLLI